MNAQRVLHPGTVVRWGNDPCLYVRNLDATWSRVYLGYLAIAPRAGVSEWVTDASVMESVDGGHAAVVYESQPAREGGLPEFGAFISEAFRRSVRSDTAVPDNTDIAEHMDVCTGCDDHEPIAWCEWCQANTIPIRDACHECNQPISRTTAPDRIGEH